MAFRTKIPCAAAGVAVALWAAGCARAPAPELPRFPEYAPAALFLEDFERRQDQVRLTQAFEMETRRANQLRALASQLEVWRRMEEGLVERQREQEFQEMIRERNRIRQVREGQNLWSGVRTATERNYAASEEARRAHRQRAAENNMTTWRRKDEALAERLQEEEFKQRILERERKRQLELERGTWAGVKSEAETRRAEAEAERRSFEGREAELTGTNWSDLKTEADTNRAAAEAERRRYQEQAEARDKSKWSDARAELERELAEAEQARRNFEARRAGLQQAAWGDIRTFLERDLAAMEAARLRAEERYAQRRLRAWASVMNSTVR